MALRPAPSVNAKQAAIVSEARSIGSPEKEYSGCRIAQANDKP